MAMTARGRGQSLVEFTLLLPVLLLIIFGLVDFGRAAYAYNALSNASREGVRTAIVNQTVSAVAQRTADQATALGIDPTSTACPTPAGNPTGVCVQFMKADLSAACSPVQYGCVASVTAKYTFTALTPIIGNVIGPISLFNKTVQPIESLCVNSVSVTCPVP